MRYTEDQIREAVKLAGHKYAEENIIGKLKMSHAHDWADDDTITVREVRRHWGKWFDRTPGHQHNLAAFLQDISEDREPEYPPMSIWSDAREIVWRRSHDGCWHQFGNTTAWEHDIPRRPLKRLA